MYGLHGMLITAAALVAVRICALAIAAGLLAISVLAVLIAVPGAERTQVVHAGVAVDEPLLGRISKISVS